MMSRDRWTRALRPIAALAAVLLAIGAGCGGRDKEGEDDVLDGVGSFTVSGTMSAASGNAADSDTNDPSAPFASNDSSVEAQEIPNPVTLGGHANAVGAGAPGGRTTASGDVADWFRVSIAAGQVVRLRLAEDGSTNDLDLELLDQTETQVAISSTTSRTETISVAASDDYYVVVHAVAGASNYTLTIGQTPTGSSGPPLEAEFVPGQVVVRYRDGFASAAASDVAAGMGLRHVAGDVRGPVLLAAESAEERARAFSTLGLGASSAGEDAATLREETLRLVEAVRALPGVGSADLNYIRRPTATPADEFYPFQWHYDQINLPQAWDIAESDDGIVVAVLDTGVKDLHPDLSGQLVPGYDFIMDTQTAADGDGCDADPDDPGDGSTPGSSTYHGTHVIGTVAARTSLLGGNTDGVAGVAYTSQVMPLRVLGRGGGTDFDVMTAVSYAANRANDCSVTPGFVSRIVNMSLGGPGFSQTFQDLITDLRTTEGMIFVGAAGNANSSANFYPAAYDGVISVSAVGPTKTRAPYSNFGATIDIAAPGGDFERDVDGDGYPDGVLSTFFDESDSSFVYAFYQGTSMAAPHVAGVLALMLDINPALTPFDIDNALVAGELTEDIGDAQFYGRGLIDAVKAVNKAAEGGGGATVLDPFLRVDPDGLNFGFLGTTFLLDASNGGNDAESLVVSSATPDAGSAAWLTVTAESVDADGLGSYRATVDRTGLANGIYTGTITFVSDRNDVDVRVIMQVGDPSAIQANAGYHYILLVDPVSFLTVAETEAVAVNGQYSFSMTNVPSGNYYLVAGTDLDNDLFICDAGEACGGYPTTESITPISVNGDVGGFQFVTGFSSGISGANTGAPSGGSGYSREVGQGMEE